LIHLYLTLIQKEGYEYTVLETDYNPRHRPTAAALSFIKSFGVAAISGVVPAFPKTTGAVSRGIICSIYNIVKGIEGVDLSLFKLTKVSNPSVEVFGDVWGKNYPEEKRMLDYIVHFYRTQKSIKWDIEISKYMINPDQIAQNKGLDVDVNDELLCEEEREFANSIFKSKNSTAICSRDRLKCNDFETLKTVQEYIKERQKRIRQYKETLKTILSSRVLVCYESVKHLPKTSKARQAPIRDLKADVEYTREYKVFNPTRLGRFYNVTPLIDFPPNDDKEEDLYHVDKERFVNQCVVAGVSKPTAQNLVNAHTEYLKLTIPRASRR